METEFIKFFEKYGGKYRAAFSEGVNEDTGRRVRLDCYIPSRRKPHPETGQAYQVYPFGGGTLAAVMPVRKSRSLMKRFPFLRLHVEASDCAVLLFTEDRLPLVAGDMGLRTRRRLSPEHKAKLVAAGLKASAPFRYKQKEAACSAQKTG
jgi:hypothetical protein